MLHHPLCAPVNWAEALGRPFVLSLNDYRLLAALSKEIAVVLPAALGAGSADVAVGHSAALTLLGRLDSVRAGYCPGPRPSAANAKFEECA